MNLPRILDLKKTLGLDAIVVTLPENITYLTGYSNPLIKYFNDLDEFAVLVGPKPDITLIIPGVNGGFSIGQGLSATHLALYGNFVIKLAADTPLTSLEQEYVDLVTSGPRYANALAAVEAVLHDAGVSGGRVGIDLTGFSAQTHAGLTQRLPTATLVDISQGLLRARAVKTPAEIDRLRASAQVNQAAYGALRAAVRPGVTVADILTAYRVKIAEYGGEFAFSSTGAGRLAGGPWLDTRLMTLMPGDLIRYDGVMRYQDYFADFGRTLAVQHVPARAQRVYDAIYAGYRTALDMVRHGTSITAMFQAALAAVRRAGLPDFDRHHIGHGIGLSHYDYPILAPGSDATLETGMVICVELPVYTLGEGGWQLEDTLVVTDHGYEYITTLDRDIDLCG